MLSPEPGRLNQPVVPTAERRAFVSYSHHDREWLQQLQLHLRPLERTGAVEYWDDTQLRPGDEWRRQIDQALSTARAAVLLISPHFLASEFICNEELPVLVAAARVGRLTLLPVVLRPCGYWALPELSAFQAVNNPERPLIDCGPGDCDRVWLKVVEAVARALQPTGAIGRGAPAVAVVFDELLPALQAAVAAAPGLKVDVIWEAHELAAPPRWISVDRHADPAVAARLACLNLAAAPLQPDGSSPPLSFVRALLPHLGAGAAPALKDVIRRAGRAVGEVDAPPPRPVPPPSPHPDARNYLVVAIRRAESARDLYEVRGWFDGGGSVRCLAAGERHLTRAELPAELDRLRRLAATQPGHRSDLWIEFLLSRELLTEAVDFWEVRVPGLGTNPVGAQHHVLLRAADRYFCDEEVREERLAAFHQRGGGLAPDAAHLVVRQLPPPCAAPDHALHVPLNTNGRELYNQLLEHPSVRCAVLEDRPPNQPTDPWDLLNVLLSAGVPVIAWSRGTPPRGSAPLAGLIPGRPLGALPREVRSLRRGAVDHVDPEHPGRHAALLWDHPARTPPDIYAGALSPPNASEVHNG